MQENNTTSNNNSDASVSFTKQIERKQIRKLQSKESVSNFWVSFTSFGVLGWTIVTPTLVGIALGIWLDQMFPTSRSWTLMLMAGGLILGCFNGWRWIEEERERMEEENQTSKNLVEKMLQEEGNQEKTELDK